MLAGKRPLVPFVVPPLSHGRYVVRAVDSSAIISEFGLVWDSAIQHGQATRVIKQIRFALFGVLLRVIRRAGDRIENFASSDRSSAGLR